MENAILSESFFNGHRGSFNWNQWGFIGGSESHLSGCIRLFVPKLWEVTGIYKCYLFTLWLQVQCLGTFRGDRDTQTQPAVIIKNLPFCTHRRWGCKYISLVPSRPSHQMKLFLINIFTLSTRMHSSRMRTAHSSSRHGGWVSTPPGKIPLKFPLGVGLDQIPLNFPLGCGPALDPPQLPPWVWGLDQIPLNFPLGVGLEPPPRTRSRPPPKDQAPSPWTEFLTHVCENITLPQTSFAGGNEICLGMCVCVCCCRWQCFLSFLINRGFSAVLL